MLDDKQAEADAANADVNAKQQVVDQALTALNNAKAETKAKKQDVDNSTKALADAQATADAAEDVLTYTKASYENQKAIMDDVHTAESDVAEKTAKLDAAKNETTRTRNVLNGAEQALRNAEKALADAQAVYDSVKDVTFENMVKNGAPNATLAEIQDYFDNLKDCEEVLDTAKANLADAQAKYDAAKDAYDDAVVVQNRAKTEYMAAKAFYEAMLPKNTDAAWDDAGTPSYTIPDMSSIRWTVRNEYAIKDGMQIEDAFEVNDSVMTKEAILKLLQDNGITGDLMKFFDIAARTDGFGPAFVNLFIYNLLPEQNIEVYMLKDGVMTKLEKRFEDME